MLEGGQDSERRRWQRIPLAIPVFVRGIKEGGEGFVEFTTALNLSAGGALLATRRYLPPSSRVSLEIPTAPLPRLAFPPRFVRTIKARVLRVAHSNGGTLSSLRFTRPLI